MTEPPTDLAREALKQALQSLTACLHGDWDTAKAIESLVRAIVSEDSNGLDEKIRHIIGDMFAASLPEITVMDAPTTGNNKEGGGSNNTEWVPGHDTMTAAPDHDPGSPTILRYRDPNWIVESAPPPEPGGEMHPIWCEDVLIGLEAEAERGDLEDATRNIMRGAVLALRAANQRADRADRFDRDFPGGLSTTGINIRGDRASIDNVRAALRASVDRAREALQSAPRPGTGDSDLVAYMDWFFQVRGRVIAELDALAGKGGGR